MMRQAQLSLACGAPLDALSQFTALLETAIAPSLVEDAQAWLAKIYLKLRDFERCHESLKRIEHLRRASSTPPSSRNAPAVDTKRSKQAAKMASSADGNALFGADRFEFKQRCLLEFAGKQAHLDLAELRAKALFHCGQYADALKVLAPAHALVETNVRLLKGTRQHALSPPPSTLVPVFAATLYARPRGPTSAALIAATTANTDANINATLLRPARPAEGVGTAVLLAGKDSARCVPKFEWRSIPHSREQ